MRYPEISFLEFSEYAENPIQLDTLEDHESNSVSGMCVKRGEMPSLQTSWAPCRSYYLFLLFFLMLSSQGTPTITRSLPPIRLPRTTKIAMRPASRKSRERSTRQSVSRHHLHRAEMQGARASTPPSLGVSPDIAEREGWSLSILGFTVLLFFKDNLLGFHMMKK